MNNHIEFKNSSRITCLKSKGSVRSKSSQVIYYSDAFKRFNTLKGQIELALGQAGKLKWHQKLRVILCIVFWKKYYDIVNYFTNPYRVLNKYINKRGKRRDCGFYEDKANDWE